jgi:VWFA-related protein
MHLVRFIAGVLFASLPIAGFTAIGQGPAQSAASAPAAIPTLFHTGANLVLLDVVVTDKGALVHGLDQKRFHIFEDGHEQPISSFDEHQPPAAPTPVVAARQTELPPSTYTNVPVYPEAGVVNVLLLDALNTPMANQFDARRQMIEYMGKITPGTSLAIFTLTSKLRLVEGFTTNVADLTKALKSSKANAQASVVLDPKNDSAQQTIDSTIASMIHPGGPGPSAEAVGALLQFEADLTASQTDIRVRTTLDAMQQLARYLSAIPGRKNLIWFSGSFPMALSPDSDQSLPFLAVRTYSDEIRKTSELLTAARVAVYPVDARGMLAQSTTDAAYSPSATRVTMSQGKLSIHGDSMNDSNVVSDYEKFMTQTMEEHGSMEQVANETGGKAYINTNDLKEAVANAVENGASFYTLTYIPTAKKFNGRFRKIQVRMENGGYKLAYRTGYYADPMDKTSAHNPAPTNLISSSTLHGAPPSTQVLFQARVLAATDPAFGGMKMPDGPAGDMVTSLKGKAHRYLADLTVDPRGLAFDNLPVGVRQAQLEFVMVAYDAEGKRLNYVDRSFAINIKPEQFAQKMADGIHARLTLDLPEGQEFLRIAVQDLIAGRAGALELPLAVAPD